MNITRISNNQEIINCQQAESLVYETFLKKARLTDRHRVELKEKRGFSDKTIDELRFVSGHQKNRAIISELRQEYGEDILLNAGLLERKGNEIVVQNQLLDDRVIIPYLDENGQATLLRPHKLGLKDVGIQIYCPYFLKDKPVEIILTEGEFKVAAIRQWGFSAIGIPGIASYSQKRFGELVNFLKEYGVKELVVVFDNEKKSDPGLPNYKDRPEKRYDTQYYAYIMAYKLGKHFDTRVGTLPDEWRENGKIDFDMALAQGRTKADIQQVIAGAIRPEEYRKSFEGEAKKVLERKITRYFSALNIKRRHGKYCRSEKGQKEGQIAWIDLSNFLIDIQKTYFSKETGCMRQITFTNEFGETSQPFYIEPKDMASPQGFEAFCLSKGNYIWKGKKSDLQAVWEFELMKDSGEMIYMLEQIGEVQPGFWVFGNIAIKDGQEYEPDEEGIFWIDGKGYLPQPLETGPAGEESKDLLPELYTKEDVSFQEIAEKFKANLGGYESYIAIGWAIATIFSRDIYREFRNFPILFAHGKREAGKTTLMRWVMQFFGIETGGKSIAESTQNFIMRLLSYRSSLGAWFDEYRNEKKINQKDGYLRSAYNRQSSGKGITSTFGAKGYEVNATLALSGEELPKDSGLYTRLTPLRIAEKKRNRQEYEWLNANQVKFSALTYHLIKNYHQLKSKIVGNIKKLRQTLQKTGISDRTAEVWAIPAASFLTVIEKDVEEFTRWILQKCRESRETAEDEHILNIFWSDILVLQSQGQINNKHIDITSYEEENCIALWFPAAYKIWAEDYRRRTGKEPFDRASIRQYIAEEAYYIGDKSIRLDGHVRTCYIINPNIPETPNEVKDIKEVLV